MTSVLQPRRAAERTDDGRYVVVDGRRWRASDPGIPEDLLGELVSELMAARRAVASAKSKDDKLALAEARRRVSDAKLALGERGRPWWETPSPHELRMRAQAAYRALSQHRARDASGSGAVSTVEVARVVASDSVEDAIAQIGPLNVDARAPL